MLNFDFALIVGLDDGVNQRLRSGTVRQFTNGNELIVDLFNRGPNLDLAAAFAPVVIGYVDGAAGREIGVKLRFLTLQDLNGFLAKFLEVVR